MEIAVDDTGFAETLDNINVLPTALAARVTGQGLVAAARVIRDEARRTAPVRTGVLKASIRASAARSFVSTSGGRKKVAGTAANVRVRAPHAHLVEFGHGGPRPAPPHPFLVPAVESTGSRQVNAAVAEMQKRMAALAAQLAGPPESVPKSVRRLAAL